MIKLSYCLTRAPTLSRAEFQDYWRNHHAPLVMTHAKILRFRRYIQTHTTSNSATLPLAGVRGSTGLDYDGVAEFWWDDMAALSQAASTPEGRDVGRVLLEDERRFIDLTCSPIFLSEELVIFDRARSDLFGGAGQFRRVAEMPPSEWSMDYLAGRSRMPLMKGQAGGDHRQAARGGDCAGTGWNHSRGAPADGITEQIYHRWRRIRAPVKHSTARSSTRKPG